MKKHVVLVLGFLFIFSCSKNNETEDDIVDSCSKTAQTFTNDYGTELILEKQLWYLKTNGIGGGTVYLTISGSISGDKATIRTYGDGLINDEEIELNSEKQFEKNVAISFTATSVPQDSFTQISLIRVISGIDTLSVELESCSLKYE